MPEQPARGRSATLLFYGCLIFLGYVLYLMLRPFLAPLTWAAILAAYFFRRHKRLEGRFGRTAAATVSTVAVTLIIVVPFVLVAVAFIQQASQTFGHADLAASSSKGVARLQQAWMWTQRQRFGQSLGSFDDAIKQATAWLAGVVADSAGDLLRNVLVLLADLVIMLFALFFFFRDGDAIMSRIRGVLPFEAGFRERRIAEAAALVRASISSGLIVALAQGAVGGLAFAVLGLGAPVFWGVSMAFFALLPLGAGMVWATVAVWLLLTGQVGRGIALMIIGAGGIGLIDNVLRPILLSGRTEMNGLLVFISLLGGLAAFGLLGLVLGPIIMAFTISFIDAYATDRTGPEPAIGTHRPAGGP
jgi:predicted PurR-regulated permease PerM